MSFFRIAFKNVEKKMRSYLIYFFSIVFSVMIFYLFCSLYYNPVFKAYRFGTGKISALFRGTSVAVFLFVAIFVLYSGSYFIKIQKKEIAIYSLFGMRKSKIAFMMFLETVLIGMAGIFSGIIVGICTSSYFTKILMRFMAVGTAKVQTAGAGPVIVTIAAFAFLFAVSGFRAYFIIYRYSLLELLVAERKNEELPHYSIAGSIAALIFLMCGYAISMSMQVDVGGAKLMGPVLVGGFFVICGTFLLFRNVIPMLLAILKKKKSFYYKISNMIGVSQIAFRIEMNYKMLSVIALLISVTIIIVSASYSFYDVLAGDATKSYAPYSYLMKNVSKEQYTKVKQSISDIGEIAVKAEDKIELIKIKIQNDRYAVKDQQTGIAECGKSVDAYLISEDMYEKIIVDTKTKKEITVN